MNERTALIASRIMLAVVLIPAIIMSSKRFDVIGLFLVADLVCSTAVFPVFLGLITEDIGFIPAPTELGAFLGIWSGIAAVLVNGKVIGFTEAVNSITGETIATGPWSYFWLTNSTECALCGQKTMVTFIITPIVAGFFTLFFSKIDIAIRGERARQPIFIVAQPEPEAENYKLHGEETKELNNGEIEVRGGDSEDMENQVHTVNDDVEKEKTSEDTSEVLENEVGEEQAVSS